jgi:ATP adenylyltransferase
MDFDELLQFVERDMRMSHIYQPVMLRELLSRNGRATVAEIARAFLNEDRSQIEYYSEITKNMVGRVLTNRNVVKRDAGEYLLLGYENLAPDQVQRLKAACEVKLSEYLARRGDGIWEHRRRSAGYISGSLRYEVLKNAKFCCELCGIPAVERALEVDHIIPRNKGGTDEIANLQALCFSCNAMKRDRDDTDFRAVRREYDRDEQACPFSSIPTGDVLIENRLSLAVRDKYPVTDWHILVVPKRHTSDYFDLGTAESRACDRLLTEARSMIRKADPSVKGFNVGINSGEVAGQTVMHCHIQSNSTSEGRSPESARRSAKRLST